MSTLAPCTRCWKCWFAPWAQANNWIRALIASSAAMLGGCVALTPNLVNIIQRTSSAVVGIGDGREIVGSGFRLAESPLIATAAHLLTSVRGTPTVVWNNQRWSAQVLRIDEANDLALLEIDPQIPIPGLTLGREDVPLRPGEWVVVLGRPFGAGTTATVGIVSASPGAVLEPKALRKRVQLNAAINPGNSGGPVVNLEGHVIGVAHATVPGGSGIGFAIPVQALADLISAHPREL